MFQKNFYKGSLKALAMLSAMAFASASSAAIVSYSTDFESTPLNPNPIGDGWLGFINQFDEFNNYAGGYVYPIGTTDQVANINTSEGGASQGAQVLSVYSDYENRTFMTNGNPGAVETNVYQDQGLINPSQVGEIWSLSFDAKQGNITGTASANAFVKILDAGFQPVPGGLITLDTSEGALSTDWNRYSITFEVLPNFANQRLQFGFSTLTGNDVPSGNFYDNVNLSAVPVPAAVWLFGSGLIGLIGIARRNKS